MAVTTTIPNHYKYLLKTAGVNELSDTYKIILMDSSFAFDPASHALLADVTAHQISTANGYTQNNKELSGVSVVENDALDMATTTWSDVSWTASGGDIGPAGAAIVYNDTAADDPIACCIDFGTDITTPNGFSFQLQAPEIDLT